jgi:hypothetical protein
MICVVFIGKTPWTTAETPKRLPDDNEHTFATAMARACQLGSAGQLRMTAPSVMSPINEGKCRLCYVNEMERK